VQVNQNLAVGMFTPFLFETDKHKNLNDQFCLERQRSMGKQLKSTKCGAQKKNQNISTAGRLGSF
jgi:hypothetical protein